MEHKQITIAVAIITNEKGEILLAKRNQPDLRHEHNKWEFVGGGIDFGETPEQALVREVKEESGLDIKIIKLFPKILTHIWEEYGTEKAQIIIISYECKVTGGELGTSEPEISELKFIDPKNIDNYDCLPNVKKIIDLLNLTS